MEKSHNLISEVEPARQASDGRPSASPVYRSTPYKDVAATIEGVSTLLELFDKSVRENGEAKCLGARERLPDGGAGDYVWWNYTETGKRVTGVASALKHLGIKPSEKIGVYGANCPEWMVAMQACNRMGYVCVPLYDSLGEDAVEYIITHSEACVVFVSAEKMEKLVLVLPKVKDVVRAVVYWGDCNKQLIETAKDVGMNISSFDEVLELGYANEAAAIPPKPDDLSTIMYTSGTTGNPKGVMLTHAAVIYQVASLKEILTKYAHFGSGEIYISYLPLAHIFDRVTEELFIAMGGGIGYWRGNVLQLVDDIIALKPSLVVGVPRVFDRIYAKTMQTVSDSGFIKKALFNFGYRRKLNNLNSGVPYDKASPIFDWLVFKKVKARLGGNVRLIVSGGAPISRHTEDFLRTCFCCPVCQGYGLTETCGGSFITLPGTSDQIGTVGPPTPAATFRLESIPDMNYDALANPPKGEILIKGDCNFTGYYKSEKLTDEVVEKDGWFHTGDVGTIMENGALKIIDRKKNIFKLSQGEYVQVEKVENVYKKNPNIEQMWVYGNSFKPMLVAILVPVKDLALRWATEHGITGDFAEICQNPDFNKHLLDSITRTGKEGSLKGFELVKAIFIEPNQFTVENQLITPTFKFKRPQLLKKYQEQIDELYAKLENK